MVLLQQLLSFLSDVTKSLFVAQKGSVFSNEVTKHRKKVCLWIRGSSWVGGVIDWLYSQPRKNWDLYSEKTDKFFPEIFFLCVAPVLSSSRPYFSVFWQYFTVKNQYLKKVVFIIWASTFSSCLRSKNTLILGPRGPPSSELWRAKVPPKSWNSWEC